MKAFLILLFSTLMIESVAQNLEETSLPSLGPYFWKVRVPMTEVDYEGNETESPSIVKLSLPNQKFEIVRINKEKDYAVIIISRYLGNPVLSEYFNYVSDSTSISNAIEQADAIGISSTKGLKNIFRNKSKKKRGEEPLYYFNTNNNGFNPTRSTQYFKVMLGQIKDYAIKNTFIPLSFEFGLINFPFKYRLSKSHSNFTGSFNFGAALGFKFKSKTYKATSFSFITGYSVSSTTLETSDVRRNAPDLSETNDFTSISFSAGPMIENNRVQVGLFFGLDFLGRLNQERYGWHHQGKPWFSVGFGYTIFSKQEEKASKEKN